ncbi:MAG: proton-conducting transporter membrane subunit [Candidatus Omnitrophota bacterium]
MEKILLLFILAPLSAGVLCLLMRRLAGLREVTALFAGLVNLLLAVLFLNSRAVYSLPLLGQAGEFSLRLYNFSSFMILAAAVFGFLVILYSSVFMRGRDYLNQFYAYILITLAFINAALLADNLLLMLFFWEGLLLTLFGLIAIGGRNAFKAATKALIIAGASDFCLMLGIIMTGHLAGTLTISRISLPLSGLAGVAFILLVIGAISKAGSMPFHSWIPDAAENAPLPFMAILPASLEKLLGIYFLARISLDMFKLAAGSWASSLLMIVGSVTILFAVMMALVQKDFKRLLSYHAVSQVGYMILGIGTLVPAGIVGGLFHLINNALYKSCLFLSAGSVEKQAGSTDLESLGGLRLKMPITFICFTIAALSISGVPPFNGFFSKELIYGGALERGWIFYLAAVGGSFLTAASFLKLGHAAFLGRLNEKNKAVKEAPLRMLAPMLVVAATCVIFGLLNFIPLRYLIQPVIGQERLGGHDFSGLHVNVFLFAVTIAVLIAALLDHLYGVRKTGSGLRAVDHIHYAPLLGWIYDKAQRGYFDPYNIGMGLVRIFAHAAWCFDRTIDWMYDVFAVKLAFAFSYGIRKAHNGNYSLYVIWAITGAAMVVVFLLKSV